MSSNNNNNQQQRRIVEDAPQMRSVRIQQPSVAPAMPFGRAAVGSTKTALVAPTTSQKLMTPPGSTTKAPAWNVNSNQLQAVPSYYRLERTHLMIDNVAVAEIASRIAACLREESVSATFHNDETMIEAETHEGVTFTTRLFQGQNDKIIVELQRQAGCCYLFQQTAKCILRAAKGMPPSAKRRTLPIPPSMPKSNVEEDTISLKQGLELAAGLLKKDRIDAHLLAMESLTHMSRSSKCQCLVVKAILTGPLLETLVLLVESWSLCAAEKGEHEEQYCAQMHRLAMGILANCLTTLEAEGELREVLANDHAASAAINSQLCSPSLLMALVGELRNSETRPHDACEAARCLQPLVRNCPLVKPRLLEECDAMAAASMALDAGISCHANLEQECQRLQLVIKN